MNRQDTSIRKKRQERDAQLKKQAETARRKRKHPKQAKANGGKPRESVIKKPSFHHFLPDEYLEDNEEHGVHSEIPLVVARTKPKKIKFTDLVEKKPKDRRKSTTTYRVSEICSNYLAPKSSFHAKTTKEAWLKGRASTGGGAQRSASVGFFKK